MKEEHDPYYWLTAAEVRSSPDWQSAFVVAGERAREAITGKLLKFRAGDVTKVDSTYVGTDDHDLANWMGLFVCSRRESGKKKFYVFIKAGCKNWDALTVGEGHYHESRNVLVADMKVEDCERLGVSVDMSGKRK